LDAQEKCIVIRKALIRRADKIDKIITEYIEGAGIEHLGRIIIYSIIVGIISGFGALVFNAILSLVNGGFLQGLARYFPPLPGGERSGAVFVHARVREWIVPIIPMVGGILSGLLVYTFAPEAEGHGTDALIDAYHRRRAFIRPRVPLIKTIASAFTIGTGGSAGREGPIAQIGAGFAAYFSRILRLSDKERRALVLAGAGAGIGAIFRAPLGGALFATEVLYRQPEFEYEAIIPAFISSIVAYSLYCTLWGGGFVAIFDTPRFAFRHPMQLMFYAILAFLLALVGMFYVKTFYYTRDKIFAPLKIPRHLKPAIGGLGVGMIALFIPQVMGMGYGFVQEAIDGRLAIGFMVTLAVVKIFATSLTVGSGGSGGVFAPSLVIGGLLGGAFGQVFHAAFPGIVDEPSAFVLVGMAGFFAGVAKVPIASMIMVSEMAVGYALLVPLMLVTAVAYLFSRDDISIYEKQVNHRIDSPAHQGDFIVDILEGMKVTDILSRDRKVAFIPEASSLDEILRIAAETSSYSFPVVSSSGKMVGIISLDDVRGAFLTDGLGPLVIAKDIAVSKVDAIFPDESLNAALRKFISSGYEELPVVDRKDKSKVVGMLTRHDLIVAYNARLRRMKEQLPPAPGG
jgi:CIC family chloride channel protein